MSELRTNFDTYANFFDVHTVDPDIFEPVLEYAREIAEREKEFDLRESATPKAIKALGCVAMEEFGIANNTAIVKHYVNDDGYISGAYSLHRDPPRFRGKMASISLQGETYFWGKKDDGIITPRLWKPGTMIIWGHNVHHAILPPLKTVRYAIFFGHDITKRTA